MNQSRKKILVTGACGQLGTELTAALRKKHGWENVVASDVRPATGALLERGPYIRLDVVRGKSLSYVLERLGIGEIYHLAAMLSAKGEADPHRAWHLNMQGLLNVLEAARLQRIRKVFWPSSIAVFGPASLRAACVQSSATDPLTVYGISKCSGEYWCRWYRTQHGLDVRSLRYPGLISHSAPAGGGTTDYAVDIFHAALKQGDYTCFLEEDTQLPMLYMPDAVRATLELMEAPRESLTVKTSYNLAGIHFTPCMLAAEIQRHLPDFRISYQPDHRQQIADSWPTSILDLEARKDWGWRPEYDLPSMVTDMLFHLSKQYQEELYAAG